MNIPATYDYLVRARRELWTSLRAQPDAVLSRDLIPGERFRCIKDLVFHIAAVEDGWTNEDILRLPPALDAEQGLDGPGYADCPLERLLRYWERVENNTLRYFATLTDVELNRVVTVHDAPDERYTVRGLLAHVMFHEIRHTAQIALLLRMQGIKPPALDLLWYLPRP